MFHNFRASKSVDKRFPTQQSLRAGRDVILNHGSTDFKAMNDEMFVGTCLEKLAPENKVENKCPMPHPSISYVRFCECNGWIVPGSHSF